MKHFVVIGYPISHSASPALHNAGFREMNIDADFVTAEIKPENLESWVRDEFRANHINGAAVTIPHKETIRKFLDGESESARKIGAVNTLYWEGKNLVGTNTDCIGALKALHTVINPASKKTLILGAGGASRAIIFALKMAESNVSLWNRTKEKAEKLAQEFDVEHIDLLEKINSDEFDIIINTTSVGLNETKSVFPKDFWRPHHTAFDIVYSPLETQFLQDAQNAGAKIVTGDLMLVHQAIEQFRIWNNIELDPDVMSEAFFR